MKKNSINWFEIYVADFDRSQKFYETILNTKLVPLEGTEHPMAMFPVEEETCITGAIMYMEECKPGPGGTLVYLNVEGEMQDVISRIADAGGKVVRDRFAIPPHGFIAIFEDTEGNVIGLHSMS